MPCILLLTAPPRHSKYCIAPNDELLSLKRTKGVKPDVVPNTCKGAAGPVVPIPTPLAVSVMPESPSVSERIHLAIWFGVPEPEVSAWTESAWESVARLLLADAVLSAASFGLATTK